MGKHWTMVIQMKEVHESEPIRDGNHYAVKVPQGIGTSVVAMTERRVLDRLALTVSAETEAEAYDRAIRLLEVNRPAPGPSIAG
jgi:hypothetical protein